MAQVLQTAQAREDLKSIARNIAKQSGSRAVALRFLDSVEEKCQLYATQPLIGESRPDLATEVRCFTVGNYVVIYRPLDDGILVLSVVHGARDIPVVYRRFFGRGGSE